MDLTKTPESKKATRLSPIRSQSHHLHHAMAKAKSAHLESLISSVDQLLFAGFVVSYILDGNLLGLVVKCICKSLRLCIDRWTPR